MADIVLKDRNGSSIEYPCVNHIKVKNTYGGTRDFVDSETVPEVVENLPIVLDFSGGNQEIVAPDGMVVKSAVIQKPANLIPENIPEGMDIAGLIGTMATGGGGAKIAIGTYELSSSKQTFAHNLGVIPDIIMLLKSSTYNGYDASKPVMIFGISSAFASAYPQLPTQALAQYRTNIGLTYFYATNAPVESTGHYISATDETTFSIMANVMSGVWLAIGGLT